MTGRGSLRAGLLILALWIHALAPVAALRALDLADPIAGAVICAASDSAHQADDPDGRMPSTGCSLCPLCVAGAGTAILPSLPEARPAGRWVTVAWATPPPSAASRPPPRSGRARAPPLPV